MNKFIVALFLSVILALITGCGGPVTKLSTYPINPTYPNAPYGLCLGAFPNGDNPDKGAIADQAVFSKILDTVNPFIYSAYVYTSAPFKDSTQSMPSLARQKKISEIVANAWISGDAAANTREIGYQKAEIAKGNVDVAVAGTEVMRRNDLTSEKYIPIIREIKAAGKPVAFCDIPSEIMDHPEIVAEVDIVMFNKYTLWESKSIDVAMDDLISTYNAIKTKYPNKEIRIGEIGWASAGDPVGQGYPSSANQLKLLEQVLMWANINHVKINWFEAIDEPFKTVKEGALGAHWGLWTTDFVMKPGVLDIFKKTPVPYVPVDPIVPVINSGDTTFPEGNTVNTVKIPVDLSIVSNSTVTVKYATSDLTALASTDYTATSGTLTFAPGTTAQYINLVVKGNTAVEPDKKLKITFSDPTNTTLLHSSITLTILNDDEAVLPAISAVDVVDVGTPGNHIVNVELKLSAISTKQVSVGWTTVNGTATAPTDFVQASGTAVFAAGTTVRSIPLSVNGNWVIGAGRAFQIALANPVNATLDTSAVNITIPNKAGTVGITINRDKLPTYGALTGKLLGTISGVDPANCKVACFLYINGGWWTKPYDYLPFTTINSEGAWSSNIVTGGNDQNAIKFAAYLLPKVDAAPLPVTLGSATIPAAIVNASLAHDIADRPKP